MLRIVIPVVLGLTLGGCSNKDQEVTNTPISSAPRTADSLKGTSSGAGNAVEDVAQGATRGVKEAPGEKNATSKPVRKGKEGTKQTKAAHSVVADNWSDFLATAKQCDALTGAQNTQCMTDAAATYRAWNFNCEVMAPQDRLQCRAYSERWNSANVDSPRANTPAVRSGGPNVIPADPGDSSDKERNRDSTKQQAAAAQAPKQN